MTITSTAGRYPELTTLLGAGIGRAIAVHFAREGATVAFTYLPEEQADANETERLVLAEGGRCPQLPGDLRHASFCEDIVKQTVQKLGQLNIMVSNAAEQFISTDLAKLPNEQFEDAFQVNLFAMVRVVKAAVPHLHEGDSIIATSSINAYRGNPQLVDCSATKGTTSGTGATDASAGNMGADSTASGSAASDMSGTGSGEASGSAAGTSTDGTSGSGSSTGDAGTGTTGTGGTTGGTTGGNEQ
jgi:NAD(P)-dependent dehydrogenase (short-subunit alcohol dehydrogenase family)